MQNRMTTQTFPNADNFLPEIVLGIVSPVGTDVSGTLRCLKAEFENKKFEFHHIKLSKLFPSLAEDLNYIGLDDSKKFNRTDTYIKFGNYVRDNIGTKSLAVFAISEIARLRSRAKANIEGIAYVVDRKRVGDPTYLSDC
jgi:hypothetical protein